MPRNQHKQVTLQDTTQSCSKCYHQKTNCAQSWISLSNKWYRFCFTEYNSPTNVKLNALMKSPNGFSYLLLTSFFLVTLRYLFNAFLTTTTSLVWKILNYKILVIIITTVYVHCCNISTPILAWKMDMCTRSFKSGPSFLYVQHTQWICWALLILIILTGVPLKQTETSHLW